MKILIKNVMIADADTEIIKSGYVLIEGETIKDVGPGDYLGETLDTRVIEGKNYCIMPGLINCHTHLAMTLLRGYGEGLSLMRWLNEKIWPMEAKFRSEHIKIGTELALVEMLRTGTTTFNDMYFIQETVKECAEDFNVRAVLGFPIMGSGWEQMLSGYLPSINKINSLKSEMCKAMLAPHSAYTLDDTALKGIAAAAKLNKCGIHVHVSETEDEQKIVMERYKKTPTELLLDTGVFDVNTMAAHCIYLSDSDMDIIKSKCVNPVYNPQSNMKLASGTAKVMDMLNKDINVCIGTDGASSNNNLNMFEEIETGALLQKLFYKDSTALSGKKVLELATINGAKALGFNNLGRIKPGYLADMVMINLNKPSMTPIHDIYSNIAFSANGSEIEYVIINGKIVMENGEFTTIDEERVIFESKKTVEKLLKG
ncbi:MAG: amidohydrolase [Solirubrobacterales bacterium]